MLMYAGTQKAASTWLHSALRTVPGLAVARKEWHYWDNVNRVAPRVAELFDVSAGPRSASRFAAVFEASPPTGVRLAEAAPRRRWATIRTSGALTGRPIGLRAEAAVAALRPTGSALAQWVAIMRRWDVGDFTPDNCVLSEAQWAEIAAAAPDLQVVVGVRNPARRAWSSLSMYVDRGWLVPHFTPEEALRILAAPMHRERSRISATVEALHRVFGADRVLLVALDDVAERPREVVREVLRRLGAVRPLPADLPAPDNVGGGRVVPPPIREALEGEFASELARLERLAGRELRA